MIKIEDTNVVGWQEAIRGMRNPMNSWGLSDSGYFPVQEPPCNDISIRFVVGANDLTLMKKLVKAGTDHRKFMRMIIVYIDVNAPLYWWKEYDTYKVGTVANSCSTMHKLHSRDLRIEDFSTEHLDDYGMHILEDVIQMINVCRKRYIETRDKTLWDQMIQLLPNAYNQKRTLLLNYEVLANIYKSRKEHKLDEWREFCKWIETLPHAKELICID